VAGRFRINARAHKRKPKREILAISAKADYSGTIWNISNMKLSESTLQKSREIQKSIDELSSQLAELIGKPSKTDESSIIGDVNAERITINDKGGSVTAILKRNLRGTLKAEKPCFGAKIELEQGVSFLLVAPGELGAAQNPVKIRVQKLERGVMISLDDGVGEVVDPMTQKVLALYEEMMKVGEVKLFTPEECETSDEEELAKIRELKMLVKSKRPVHSL
jgi:hypothetical protein